MNTLAIYRHWTKTETNLRRIDRRIPLWQLPLILHEIREITGSPDQIVLMVGSASFLHRCPLENLICRLGCFMKNFTNPKSTISWVSAQQQKFS